MFKNCAIAAIAVGCFVASQAATAAPIANGVYAIGDSEISGGSAHGVYLHSFIKQSNSYNSRRWSVLDGMVTVTSSDLTISAEVENLWATNADLRFQLDATFTVLPTTAPNYPTAPTCQNQGACNGLNNDDFIYYVVDDLSFGTLTGLGDMTGVTIDMYTRPADGSKPPQLGVGGAWHTQSFDEPGFATWLYWEADGLENLDSQLAYTFNDSGNGDINVVLEEEIDPLPTPLPASAWMLAAGIGGLMAARKKLRRQA